MFIRPGRRIKFIDKSIDFHSQKHWLGHLALDESSASDFYIRKELGLDPGWDLKDLTIDCSLLLVPWRAVRELYAVSGSCQGPRPLWCCWNVGHRIPLHLCQSSQFWSVFTAVTCHLVILSDLSPCDTEFSVLSCEQRWDIVNDRDLPWLSGLGPSRPGVWKLLCLEAPSMCSAPLTTVNDEMNNYFWIMILFVWIARFFF